MRRAGGDRFHVPSRRQRGHTDLPAKLGQETALPLQVLGTIGGLPMGRHYDPGPAGVEGEVAAGTVHFGVRSRPPLAT